MEPGQDLHFGPFRLDTSRQQLWRGTERTDLQPRALAVLCYLAERPGQVVTKSELLKTFWVGVYVTKAVVKTHVREIRRVLGEDAAAPRYIETVGREGYRFIGEVVSEQLSVVSQDKEARADSQSPTGNWQLLSWVVSLS